jgi:hypothetical protein
MAKDERNRDAVAAARSLKSGIHVPGKIVNPKSKF